MFESFVVLFVQGIFFSIIFFLYLIAPKTAHRLVGYFEEEVVISYTGYLASIDAGEIEKIPAPKIAIEYWDLPKNTKLRNIIVIIRQDDMGHRDVNHNFTNTLKKEI